MGIVVQDKFRFLVRRHRDAYRIWVPILNNFEPSVSVAIARLEAAGIHRFVDQLQVLPKLSKEPWPRWLLAQYVDEYQEAGRELQRALKESPYVPPFEVQGNLLGELI